MKLEIANLREGLILISAIIMLVGWFAMFVNYFLFFVINKEINDDEILYKKTYNHTRCRFSRML